MNFLPQHKTALFLGFLVMLVLGILAVNQWMILNNAHATFDNYYAFRGCTKLLTKTDSYGTCKTGAGETIKIVKFNDKWYLDNDLPWGCFGSICFGL